MTAQIEFRVMELLCSRLCHDLISPVMAINNGMELLAEDSGGMADDIRDQLTMSAGAAAAKLQFYRIAYGLGGQNAAPVGLGEAGRLTRGLVEDGKIVVDWPENGEASSAELSREMTKLLLNLVLLGIEALPRGGTVKVRVQSSGAPGVVVEALGENAGLKEESEVAMSADVDWVKSELISVTAVAISWSAWRRSDWISVATVRMRSASRFAWLPTSVCIATSSGAVAMPWSRAASSAISADSELSEPSVPNRSCIRP
jgi:histidine phosphotransferase ChpT